MPTVITGFSGGGLADMGYVAAGYTPIGAVEFDPAIAEVYAANLGRHVRVESIMDTDWRTFERPDLLHMSPPCPNFSQAKAGGVETAADEALASAVCRALETLTPPTFVLENVVGYRRSRSLATILAALERLGYCYDLANVNSADFGVPQTRRRLIVRAVKGGLVPHLPRPVPWVGWYAAIEDLLPTLPESAFAPWQLARLPEWLGESTLVHPTDMRGLQTRRADEPVWTITANGYDQSHAPGPRPRAFLIGSGNTQLAQVDSKARDGAAPAFTVAGNASSFDVRYADEPARTVGDAGRVGNIARAFIVDDQHGAQFRGEDGRGLTIRQAADPVFTVQAGSNKPARAWLEQGRVVAMTPRALARFQSVPDSYELPEARGLACRVIGNGVPSLLAKAIGESLLGAA